jgi:hypothetical protein
MRGLKILVAIPVVTVANLPHVDALIRFRRQNADNPI